MRGKRGRPRRRAERLLADRGYDFDRYRRELRARGVKPVIARRGSDHGSGLGAERWVVERTFAWLHNFRRLRTRYERDADLHLAFMQLGCAVICQRMLPRPDCGYSSPSAPVSRPYWSGIHPHPQIATGCDGNGPGPHSSRGSAFSGSTTQR